MAMTLLPSLAIWIGLVGPASNAEVSGASLDVYDAPGGVTAIRTGRLRKGARLVVRGETGEWLEIAAPSGSFSWVDEAAIRETESSRAVVREDRTEVRIGLPGAKLPGPPGVVLERGEAVRLLVRPSLTMGRGKGKRTFRAIEPPAEESRFVLATGVDQDETATPIAPRTRLATLSTVAPGGDLPAPPSEVAESLGKIEADHRRALRGSMESWRLEPIAAAYQSLLGEQTSPAARDAVQARLDQVRRQTRIAEEARSLRSLLDQSRGRDAALSGARARLQGPPRAKLRDFDAQGLLQPSSKQQEGRPIFALIGPDGSTVAYLEIPPGLDADRRIGRIVGARGKPLPRKDLSAPLLEVHDLDEIGE